MSNIYGAWEREHSLKFVHPEYGVLLRNHQSEWEQTHLVDGFRILKADTLKSALAEAEKPYKKPKSKIKIVKRMRTKKISSDLEEKGNKKKPAVKKTAKKKKKSKKKV